MVIASSPSAAAVASALATVLVACSASGGAVAGDGGASPNCAVPAPKDTLWSGPIENRSQPFCPADCPAPIDAQQLDEAAGCRRRVIIYCVGGASYGGPTDSRCLRSPEDGRLILATGKEAVRLGWPACTDEDAKRISVDPCRVSSWATSGST